MIALAVVGAFVGGIGLGAMGMAIGVVIWWRRHLSKDTARGFAIGLLDRLTDRDLAELGYERICVCEPASERKGVSS
jgi:hypothetical protein